MRSPYLPKQATLDKWDQEGDIKSMVGALKGIMACRKADEREATKMMTKHEANELACVTLS